MPHHAHTALKKTTCGCCGRVQSGWYDRRTRRIRDLSCGDRRVYLEFEVRRVQCKDCAAVKRERLDFLADNPFYTKRFAFYVGKRCRSATIKDVAEELRVPAHAGHDSDLMPDSVPASWRTAFRSEGGHFSGRSGMLSAMIPERLGQ